MYRSSFNYLWHQFASDGYVVLYTNPRGSTGYGSEFANIIDNDYPGAGDLSDLLAGVDFVTNKGFIDESKMYVQGCSGGGVLTAWVVGHDDRFAAAASCVQSLIGSLWLERLTYLHGLLNGLITFLGRSY